MARPIRWSYQNLCLSRLSRGPAFLSELALQFPHSYVPGMISTLRKEIAPRSITSERVRHRGRYGLMVESDIRYTLGPRTNA